MASCSEQFLKVSWNSVQRSNRNGGLEIGRNGRTNERSDIRITIYPPNFVCEGYKNWYEFKISQKSFYFLTRVNSCKKRDNSLNEQISLSYDWNIRNVRGIGLNLRKLLRTGKVLAASLDIRDRFRDRFTSFFDISSLCTVDAPLTDHIWQFWWYFSYLFELNIWHSTVSTLSKSSMILQIWFSGIIFTRTFQYGLRVPFWNQKLHFKFTCFHLLALLNGSFKTFFCHLTTSI